MSQIGKKFVNKMSRQSRYGGREESPNPPGNNGWTYTDLYDFNWLEGVKPFGGVILDANGNLYCTTTSSPGTMWQLTQ